MGEVGFKSGDLALVEVQVVLAWREVVYALADLALKHLLGTAFGGG